MQLFYLRGQSVLLFICIVGGGVQTGSTRHRGHLLAYCTCTWLWGWRIWWNEWQGKPKYSEETCPGATLSTTNPTWPDPGLNPGRRGGKPATNRFSYGAANNKLLTYIRQVSCSKLNRETIDYPVGEPRVLPETSRLLPRWYLEGCHGPVSFEILSSSFSALPSNAMYSELLTPLLKKPYK
jgi:hypothetical protein